MMSVEPDFPGEKSAAKKAEKYVLTMRMRSLEKAAARPRKKVSSIRRRARQAGKNNHDARRHHRQSLGGIGRHDLRRLDFHKPGHARSQKENKPGIQ